MPLAYPLVNGVRYEWSSIEANVNGTIVKGIKEISYKESLEPSYVYGTSSQPIGRTRGVYSAEASITMYKQEAKQLRDALTGAGQNGYLEAVFNIVVNFSEAAEDPITDEIIGCRIKSPDSSHSQGADPLEEKMDLHVMYLKRDGAQGLASPLAGVTA